MATMSPLLRVMTATTTSTASMATSPTTTTNMRWEHHTHSATRWEYDNLSARPAREHALLDSGRACPHAESIILSVGGTESMILSAPAESIILSAPPTETMILSQLSGRNWEYDTLSACWEHHTLGAARWEYDTLNAAQAAMGNAGSAMGGGRWSNHVGRRDGSGTMDGTMSLKRSVRQSNFFVLSDLWFFLL